jgi:murein DD-endopeptidase MepM/ murein hydrolase activator NlpD
MQARASWSRIGRCAVLSVAAATLLFAGGCSTGSRFAFPSFNLTRSEEPPPLADPATTAALPLPQEGVYTSGSSVAYRSPASQSYAPGATQASYGRPGGPASYQETAYVPPERHPKPSARPGGTTIKVAQGDSLYSLSRRYGVPVGTIQEANGLADLRISVGQTLIIPGGKAAPRETKPVAKTSQPNVRMVKTTTITAPSAPATPAAKTKTAPAKPAESPPIAASNEITGPSGSAGQKPQLASVDRLPQPEPMSGNSFRWPVQGRIVSAFGTKPDGGHNDGIDVAVPMGTSVLAAENGVIAYAGDELKGYGNLVLIRHSNNWVSAYANNSEILVKRGDQVRRGQVIAKAGRSGEASQPQLHFELRKGSRPVDPTKYMTSAQANAD